MRDDIDLRIADEGRPDLASLVRFHTLSEGDIASEGDISVTAMKNAHPPLVNTFALSFRTTDAHIVFSGDTAYLPALQSLPKKQTC